MKRVLIPLAFLILTSWSYSQVPANWVVDEVNPGQDILLAPDEDVFSEGARSCRMTLNSGAVPYLISDDFPVEAGSAYRFSLDVLDNDTLGQLKVYCDFYDASGNNIIGGAPVFSSNNEAWTTIQWTGTVPLDAVEGYVLIKFGSEPELTNFRDTAMVWVDNCSFLKLGGENQVVNGDFEDWAVGIEDPVMDMARVTLFPNPASDLVQVRSAENIDLIRVFDLSGRMMLEQRSFGIKSQIDVRALPAGMYFLHFIREGKTIATTKLVRN